MKIAFLTPEYPHAKTGNTGGIGSSIKNLAVGLLAQGCAVRVLVYGQKGDAIFEDNGIVVQQIKNVKLKGLSWWLTRKKLERIINALYANQEIDLVEAPDWTGITSFIKPKKCPIVIRLNGSDTYFCHLDRRSVKWVNKFHEKRALQNANGHISVSRFTANLTNQLFGLNKNFTIIPNAVDLRLFSRGSIEKASLGGTKQPFEKNLNPNRIFYFGTLIRKKGLLELPFIFNKVIEQHPTVQLMLVGRDAPDIISGNASTWAMMQELFSPEALANVTYLGGVPYEEIIKHIEQATLCVFPTFAEALPVSWLEAMALQKPIVASNIGWANEMIEDGVEGYLVNPTDHITYANKIVTLLEDPELQKQFGVAARKKVEQKFSMEIVAQQSLVFYEKRINK
ncbi:MAG: glycosyltransferase family 1 protein [Flavobacteriaceae bacterium CG_4_8_14_3_um_filter_34_10]|nr:MAG: glycoside hydrolase [Flavobacteriaceae bacterium CG2_30_34_30]PIX08968.1 MAG: glycosyltransferase family 1 protein [Flavobacteriaceae bacterium CG_4_8_14_3_um_filter_34_10]